MTVQRCNVTPAVIKATIFNPDQWYRIQPDYFTLTWSIYKVTCWVAWGEKQVICILLMNVDPRKGTNKHEHCRISLTHSLTLSPFLLPERRFRSGGEINTPLLWTGLDSLYYFDPNINGFTDSVYLDASETHYV